MTTVARPARREGRILILGAGIYQVPLIERAKNMGLETHVVSYAGEFPGIGIADAFHELSTTDVTAVVALAKHLRVDGVVTSGSDVCVPTVGAVCDAMGLVGITRETAELVSRKDKFRAFQAANGMHAPRFRVVDDAAQLQGAVEGLRPPVIFKPVDSSGSRGIVQLEGSVFDHALEAFEHARSFSRCGVVCVEEVLPGMEVGGNAVLHDGRIAFLAITSKHMDRFIVRGHSYPCEIGPSQQETLRGELQRACALLDYRNGALNFDVMVDGSQATIIELGARLGGNGLTDLIGYAFGYDIESDILRVALGHTPEVPNCGQIRPCGSWVFGASREGCLRRMSTLDELKQSVPEVYVLSSTSAAGAPVHPFVHNANQLGYVLFAIPQGASWHSMAARLTTSLVLDVTAFCE